MSFPVHTSFGTPHLETLKWISTFSKDFSTLTDLRYSISSHITKEFLESFTELSSCIFSYQTKTSHGSKVWSLDLFLRHLHWLWFFTLLLLDKTLPWIFSTDVARLSYFLSQAYSPDPVLCPYSCFPCFGGV